jgi:AAA15 family ATPase/GTPase
MLKSVSVSNFKVLQRLENVDLNSISLIGGKNNAGKSSLLEAIFLHLDHKAPDMLIKQLNWRGGIPQQLSPEEIWEPFFYNFDLSKRISIELVDNNLSSRLSIAFQQNYSPKVPVPINNNGRLTLSTNNTSRSFLSLAVKYESGSNTDFSGHILITDQGTNYLIEKDDGKAIKNAVFLHARKLSDSLDADRLGVLDKTDEQYKILDFLRMFEPKLQRLILIKSGPNVVIHADIGEKKKIPVYLLGDGFCRCLSMILILATTRNGILFLDEIENGIHHSLLPQFWNFIFEASKSYNCQIIATTHSAEMIQSFANKAREKHFKDITYVRLAKKDNVVAAHQFDYDDLSYAVSSEMEIR